MVKNENKGFEELIEIPAGIEADIAGCTIILKKDSNEIKRDINKNVKVVKEGNKIILKINRMQKVEKKNLGTSIGHIKNMIEGLTKGFEYTLEICNVHFPMNVTFDQAKREIIIKNLLGERAPRILKVPGKVEVEIHAPKIKIKSFDINLAGQTAASLEKITKVRNYDRNKFQDGIFIIKKPGREYL